MRLPALLFRRRTDAHKGDFGHVFILAGSRSFSGAACLAAGAAMRSGAGLITLGVPEGLLPIVACRLTEATYLSLPETSKGTLSKKAWSHIRGLSAKTDVLLIGPGLSLHPETQALIRQVVADWPRPMVIDADGLNALAGHLDILRKVRSVVVLTPHAREMARLLGVSVDAAQNHRKEVAKDFSLRYNIVLALKGHRTIVSAPGRKIYVNQTGNPGMATAGSGDVLAGITAAFLGQGLGAYDAATAAVYLHGLAGDLAAKEKTEISLIASDIIDYLPRAFKKSMEYCWRSSVGRASHL